MRYFIGIKIPETTRIQIEKIQAKIESLPLVCKFVEPENLHICISFLGDIENVDDIATKLENVCRKYQKFLLKMNDIKLIPNEKYVRVVALGVHDQSGTLNRIIRDIIDSIGGDSKNPHVTLCRVKKISDKPNTIKYIKQIDTPIEVFEVRSIELIKSLLNQDGPKYEIVKKCELP